ncbi:glycosyltransferase family 29 protein [Mucilaginibacter auburnensis]|nr:glycosyltransferase family 29 protein [Mucilaginibacter auburnensis]
MQFYALRQLAKYNSRNVLIDFDENWFKGKRVAIVGGADSVLKEPLGAYIDGFDVVVRINKGVDIIQTQKEFSGERTDILFHSFFNRPGDKGSSPITLDLWKQHNVGLILFARNFNTGSYELNSFRHFLKINTGKIKFSQITEQQCKMNKKTLAPASPTTGFTAINTIFNCAPKEMYLTGITFFKTPHNNAYRDFNEDDLTRVFNVEKDHSAELEYQFVKKLYQQHSSVIHPDKTLKTIFETN